MALSLQPMNDRVYKPKLYLKGVLRDSPSSTSRNNNNNNSHRYFETDFRKYLWSFSWVAAALRMPEENLIEHAGLDSVVYLRIYLLGWEAIPVENLVWTFPLCLLICFVLIWSDLVASTNCWVHERGPCFRVRVSGILHEFLNHQIYCSRHSSDMSKHLHPGNKKKDWWVHERGPCFRVRVSAILRESCIIKSAVVDILWIWASTCNPPGNNKKKNCKVYNFCSGWALCVCQQLEGICANDNHWYGSSCHCQCGSGILRRQCNNTVYHKHKHKWYCIIIKYYTTSIQWHWQTLDFKYTRRISQVCLFPISWYLTSFLNE